MNAMLEINQKVQFKKGPFTDILGEGQTYTVTAVYQKGDDTDYGDTYNGSEPLYRIEAEGEGCPKPLRVLYETENSIRPANA